MNIPIHKLSKMAADCINDILEDELYKKKRYKIDSTLSVIDTDFDIMEIAKESLRKTDFICKIDTLYFIVFRYTSLENGHKALQNLFHKISPFDLCQINGALIAIDVNKSKEDLISCLLRSLEDSKHHHGNHIEINYKR